VKAVRAGFQLGLSKLLGRAGLTTVGLTLVIGLFLALLERRVSPHGAADRLVASSFRIVIPLALFSLSTIAIGVANLREVVWPAARFGHSRGLVAAGHMLAVGAAGALLVTALLSIGLLVTHLGVPTAAMAGGTKVSLLSDWFTCTWIGSLVAFAYAAWFSLGATLGRQGGGRGFVLTADFIFGPVGVVGFLLPKGPAYNLIGLTESTSISQPQATVFLLASSFVIAAIAALRAR
jgi:hypothetical protein